MSGRFEIVNPASLGAPRGFSNGVLAPAGGRLLAIAGQIAWDADGQIVSTDFSLQFGRALANVLEVVSAAGGAPEHLVQLTLYVVDRGEYLAATREVGEVYRGLMGAHYPAMALVEVAALVERDARVEIQGLAVIPPASP